MAPASPNSLLLAVLAPARQIRGAPTYCPNADAPADAGQRLLAHHAALARCPTMATWCPSGWTKPSNSTRLERRHRSPLSPRDLACEAGWSGRQLPVREACDWPQPRACTASSSYGHSFPALLVHASRDTGLVVYKAKKAGSTFIEKWWKACFHAGGVDPNEPIEFAPGVRAHALLTVREPAQRVLSALGEQLFWKAGEGVTLRSGRAFLPSVTALLRLAGREHAEQIARTYGGSPAEWPVAAYERLLAGLVESGEDWVLSGLGLRGPALAAALRTLVRATGGHAGERAELATRYSHDEALRLHSFLALAECTARFTMAVQVLSASASATQAAHADVPMLERHEQYLIRHRPYRDGSERRWRASAQVQRSVHTEVLDDELSASLRAANLSALLDRCGLPGRMNSAASKERYRHGEQTAKSLYAGGALDALLRKDAAMMQSVCRAFYQDYVCYGYALPAECDDALHPGWRCPAANWTIMPPVGDVGAATTTL